MWIIFKFSVKKIMEKKFRTFLILFSIMMSTALFFASGTLSTSVEKIITVQMKNMVGTADVMINPNDKSPSKYISTRGIDTIKDKIDFSTGMISGAGVYKPSSSESFKFNLYGYKLEELQRMNPVYFSGNNTCTPFSGKKIIISQNTAAKFELKAGDSIELFINGISERFTICGVAIPKGLFQENADQFNAVVPLDKLATLYDMKGSYSTIFIKTKDSSDIKEVMGKLSESYKKYDVKETMPIDDIKRNASSLKTPFQMMAVLVIFISVFIVYTSYKVITAEAMPIIGTFRSVGATKRITDFVMLAESATYGLVGGLLGCLAGIGMLYLMINMLLTPEDKAAGIVPAINYTPQDILTAFIVAVLLSVLSSLIPIMKVSKISIKDIVLNNIAGRESKKNWKYILGFLAALIVFIVPLITSNQLMLPVALLCMLLGPVSIILLIPLLTGLFVRLFEKLNGLFTGNEGLLAAKNLRDNKNILNNIALLAVGISAVLLINTISFSVVKLVSNVYRDFKFDIMCNLENTDRSRLAEVGKIEGITGVSGKIRAYNVKIGDGSLSIPFLVGINDSSMEYTDYRLDGDPKELSRQLINDRSIILGTSVQVKLNAKVGQDILLETKTGKRLYKVIGFSSSVMNNGSQCYIGERFLKADMQLSKYDELDIRASGNLNDVVKRVKDRFKDLNINITSIPDMEAVNQKENAMMFNIFQIFSIMTMVIGIFGVINNFAISFIQRKRSMAMMRSVGMSRLQIMKMIFIEALVGGFIGGIAGVLTGMMMITVIPYVMKPIGLPITMTYSVSIFFIGLLEGIVVSMIASISPALKSSKLNIITAIKYE